MFGRRRKEKRLRLLAQEREQERLRDLERWRERQREAHHEPEWLRDLVGRDRPDDQLTDYMAGLVPDDSREVDRAWHDWSLQIARRPLYNKHEEVARQLVISVSHLQGVDKIKYSRIVRNIGEQLCAEGGRYLMILVAHRAANLADPDWKVKQERRMAAVREMGAVGIFTAGGPFVRRIEYEWDGLCGWQH